MKQVSAAEPEIKKFESETTLDRQMHVVGDMAVFWRTMRIETEGAVGLVSGLGSTSAIASKYAWGR